MNKKKIGALLVGATLLVGAMGSFAYFTHKTSVIGGNDDNGLQAITITNGNVEISAEVTDNGTHDLDWSYDVVNYSIEEETERNTDFINQHRSPDINAKETATDTGISRAVIGSALPTNISFTRPGDAIVLGLPLKGEDGQLIIDEESGSPKSGLVVTNKSNLTVRVRLVATESNEATSKLTAMKEAGWKLYIKGEEISFEDLKTGVHIDVVGPKEQTTTPDIRFELPLLTENDKQNASNVQGTFINDLDLSEIIEIQATQENNTDWEQMNQ